MEKVSGEIYSLLKFVKQVEKINTSQFYSTNEYPVLYKFIGQCQDICIFK